MVSVTSGYRESTQSWSEVLRDLKRRGMGCPRLVIGDGHLGIWGALRNVYPQAEEQRCWNHRIVNLLAKLTKRVHKPALLILRQIPYAETREEAQRLKKVFQHWCRQRGPTLAAELIEQDWDRMVTFYLAFCQQGYVGSHTHGASGLADLAPRIPCPLSLLRASELPRAVLAVVVPAPRTVEDAAAHIAVVDGA